VEASSTGRLVYKLLREGGVDVRLANPAGIALIARSKVKTDARDAEVLAQLLRTGYMPEACVPPDDVQEIRDVVRFRVGLTWNFVAAKNLVHALLMWHDVEVRDSERPHAPTPSLGGSGGRGPSPPWTSARASAVSRYWRYSSFTHRRSSFSAHATLDTGVPLSISRMIHWTFLSSSLTTPPPQPERPGN